ncbi:hypothetical protein GJ496_006558 [Pomphorhynchus laevis]|nr:hypothetical protein GJ496_006558 [Pomphorhynchus laevis]
MDEDLSESDNIFVGVDDFAYRRRIVDVSPAKDMHATSCAHVSDQIDVDDTLDDRSVTAPDADWLGYSMLARLFTSYRLLRKLIYSCFFFH